MDRISPCLWFNNQAEAATEYYSNIFTDSKIGEPTRYSEASAKISGQKPGTVMTIPFELENLKLIALNGGPQFKFTPSLSLFVACESEFEIKEKWDLLSRGGTVRMGLDQYPWAEKYGWTADQFGVEWQLILAPRPEKIVPALLFVDNLFGKGYEAIQYYMSIFKDSNIDMLSRDEKTDSVLHCSFNLDGQNIVLMEGQGNHGHKFNHATSLIVSCDSQEEIDYFWSKLSAGGAQEQCGWLTDKFGVSWQVVPRTLNDLMAEPKKAERVMNQILGMKKLELEELKQA